MRWGESMRVPVVCGEVGWRGSPGGKKVRRDKAR